MAAKTDTVIAPAGPVRLAEYTPPAFLATTVDLLVELHDDHALVTATTTFVRGTGPGDELVLDGSELTTVSISLDAEELTEEQRPDDGRRMVIRPGTDAFTLQVTTRLDPAGNTALSGLYRSGDTYCTQMEAEGFRRVTWFQDRPDVLATWSTTVVAAKAGFPVLLSNGNLIDSGAAGKDRHFATFHDPHPKPCYLFALVAGDLARVDGSFTTRSGRDVALTVWVEHGEEHRAGHALSSLQRSMAWDERAFGREYDLDVFHIVAVSQFNMGAMENKGLNIFNSQAVLAEPSSATDDDYHRIEAIVGHEYFHNWSGNRVTCRDWFQLSLKEGFTVFRDQQFSADMTSPALQRIADVRRLRELQFAEDSGPQSHPVRPTEYVAIDNFYTFTVYEKGAEVVRMLSVLLGPDDFRAACDLYFERHDGQAATCDDFVAAMESVSGKDLSAFMRWYEQAGTPRLTARGHYDGANGTYELQLSQVTPPTHGQPDKGPLMIPVCMGLLGATGTSLPLRLADDSEAEPATTERVLIMTGAQQTFRFVGLSEEPTPSLLRSFSAPVTLDDGLDDEQLAFLVGHDPDGFNRWDASQRLFGSVVLDLASGAIDAVPDTCVELVRSLLADTELDPALLADLLSPPSELALAARLDEVDVDALHAARQHLLATLADAHADALLARHDELAADLGAQLDQVSVGRRRLKNRCLVLLSLRDDDAVTERLQAQQAAHVTMSDELCALELLCDRDDGRRDQAVATFRARWQHDELVMNKWFAAQASAQRATVIEDVRALAGDPAFDATNPNKIRSLYRTLTNNPVHFHRADGAGYRLLADVVADVDGRNPTLAGRMATQFGAWRRQEPARRALVEAELRRLAALPDISDNTREVVERSLA